MISDKDIIQVGRTQKPYGVRGEIIVFFSKAEYADADVEYYFLKIDGLLVPFFIEEFTYVTDVSGRVKFEDVNDKNEASMYVNLDLFLPRDLITEEIQEKVGDMHQFVGYSIVDQQNKMVGTIRSVDDSTLNVLFIVLKDEKELLIPATVDFFTAIDRDKKIIEMNLPEGLLDK